MTNQTAAGEWRRGWPVVLGAAIGNATGLGLLFYVSSLFVIPLSAEFGWTRAELAAPGAIASLGAFAAPLFGWVADRFGVRRVAAFCTATLAACYFGLSRLEGSYLLFCLYGVAIGVIGLGTVGFIYSRAVVAWFERGRGLALGLAASGASISAIMAPPLLNWLITDYGWRTGYLALAIAAIGVGLPAVLLLVRDKAFSRQTIAQAQKPSAPAPSMRLILGEWRFWFLALGLFSVNIGGSGVLSQLAPLLQDRGLTAAAAAVGVTSYGVGIVIGRVGCGLLLDFLPPRYVALAFTGVPAIGAFLLMPISPPVSIVLFGTMLIGLQQGSEFDIIAYVIAQSFDFGIYAKLYGAVYVFGVIGTAIGAYAFGKLFDVSGNYQAAVLVTAATFCIGSVLLAAASPAIRKAASRTGET